MQGSRWAEGRPQQPRPGPGWPLLECRKGARGKKERAHFAFDFVIPASPSTAGISPTTETQSSSRSTVLCANHRQTAGSSSHSAAPLAPTTAKLQSKAQPEPDRRREPPPNSSHQRRSTPRHRPTQPQRSRANHRRTAGCDSHSATLLAPAATEQQPDAQPEPAGTSRRKVGLRPRLRGGALSLGFRRTGLDRQLHRGARWGLRPRLRGGALSHRFRRTGLDRQLHRGACRHRLHSSCARMYLTTCR